MLTFELNETGDTLEIHADAQGLSELIGALQRLQQHGGHEHLMTPSWGGSELTEEIQGHGNRLLNQVKIMMWEP